MSTTINNVFLMNYVMMESYELYIYKQSLTYIKEYEHYMQNYIKGI